MQLIPNLDTKTRVAYIAVGLGLIAAACLAPFSSRAEALVVGSLGGIAIVEAAVGF